MPGMDDDAFRRFEALQTRARRAVAAARDARDRGATAQRVRQLVAEVDATARELDGLHTAMRTRAVIEQAKGVVMCLRNCDEQEAFAELVRISQDTQTKLHEVAMRLVAQVSRPAAPQDMIAGDPAAVRRVS